jgi:hypothetical protein
MIRGGLRGVKEWARTSLRVVPALIVLPYQREFEITDCDFNLGNLRLTIHKR